MIDVKEAVARATQFAENVLGPDRTKGMQLEEVSRSSVNGQDCWLITLSMVRRSPLTQYAVPELLGTGHRDFKEFAVSAATGEVLFMRIRALADAL
jgi:hypothetical protein